MEEKRKMKLLIIEGVIALGIWVGFFIYDWKIASFILVLMTFNNRAIELKHNLHY